MAVDSSAEQEPHWRLRGRGCGMQLLFYRIGNCSKCGSIPTRIFGENSCKGTRWRSLFLPNGNVFFGIFNQCPLCPAIENNCQRNRADASQEHTEGDDKLS